MSETIIDIKAKRNELFVEEECELEYESDEEEGYQLDNNNELHGHREEDIERNGLIGTNDENDDDLYDSVDENAMQSNSNEDQFEDTNNKHIADDIEEQVEAEEDGSNDAVYEDGGYQERPSEEGFIERNLNESDEGEGPEYSQEGKEKEPEYSESEEEQYLIEEFNKEDITETEHNEIGSVAEAETNKGELDEDQKRDPLLEIPVYLDTGDDVIKLFPPATEEDAMFSELPLLFNNTNIIDQPISEVFDTFKLYTSTLEEVIIFKIPTLSNLSIRSDSIESRSITLANILEIIDILKQKDEETYKYVQIEVSREMGLRTQLSKIRESALLLSVGKRGTEEEESGPANKKLRL